MVEEYFYLVSRFLDYCPAPLLENPLLGHVLRAAAAGLAVHEGDYAAAMPILRGHCFPTYGSERAKLIDLWYQANVLKERAAKPAGAELSTHEVLALRKRLRCDGDETNRKMTDACICGPPNLGYAY